MKVSGHDIGTLYYLNCRKIADPLNTCMTNLVQQDFFSRQFLKRAYYQGWGLRCSAKWPDGWYIKLRTLNTASEKCDFEIPCFNTTGYGKHTIRYQGPYIWSKLSKESRTSQTLTTFKMRIRKIDISDLIDNNSCCCKLCKSCTESFHIIL